MEKKRAKRAREGEEREEATAHPVAFSRRALLLFAPPQGCLKIASRQPSDAAQAPPAAARPLALTTRASPANPPHPAFHRAAFSRATALLPRGRCSSCGRRCRHRPLGRGHWRRLCKYAPSCTLLLLRPHPLRPLTFSCRPSRSCSRLALSLPLATALTTRLLPSRPPSLQPPARGTRSTMPSTCGRR